MREFSSSGTFTKDMEYSFGNGTTCFLNLSGETPQRNPFLNSRNQGIRISFDFAANNMPISNCSTRQPSIVSGLETPMVPTYQVTGNKDQKTDDRQLSPTNVAKINKELLTVQTRPTGRSISSEDLIYVNTMELHSSGVSSGCESTLSAPEQGHDTIIRVPNYFSNKSKGRSSFKNKFKFEFAKQRKRKLKKGDNYTMKDNALLAVKDSAVDKKSNSMLNIFRRKSTKRKSKTNQPDEEDNYRNE